MRMIQRTNISKQKIILIRLISVLLSLMTASLFLQFMGHHPLEVFASLAIGAFGSAYRLRETLTTSIPLVVTSIGIMIAFKMKFWNIGGEGQILMGAFAASYIALNYSELPKPLLLTLMFFAGFLGGGMWALIPALLKVHLGTNETIITLMLNYVAIKWVTYLQYGPWKDPNGMGFPQIATFEPNAILPKVFGVHIGWIIAIFIVLAISFLLAKTKKGFEISVIGESIDTARYAGMNVKHVIVAAIILSGGICGIVGMMEASGVNRTLSSNVSSGYGFTAIITTWLSGLKASIIIPVSILFAGLIKGGSFIQTAYGIPQSASDVLQALILFFIIGSEFFVQYRLVPSTSKEEL